MKKRYIVGFGNYSKNDDGIGLRMLEHIIDNNLDDGFEAVEAGNDGIRLINYFTEDTEKILVVDCALIEREPGDYLFFGFDDVTTEKQLDNISTHEGDIVKIVELAKQIGSYIPNIKVMAIQPDSLGMDMELSDTLKGRFAEYVDAAISEIKK